MKKKKQLNIKFISFTLIAIIIIFGFLLDHSNFQKLKTTLLIPTEVSIETSVIESKYLNFSVELPPEFQTVDETNQITINSQSGKISVNRNGTNFDNLDDYVSDFDTKRNLIFSDVEKISDSPYESISRIVEFPDQGVKQKSYYIYINNWVYIFSTTSEDLYDELDQIARSFKYTGN